MTQAIAPFYGGEDPTGIAYSGTIERVTGARAITVQNYMSVYMVVGDLQIPPCFQRTLTLDGVTDSVAWKITHPSSFIIQRKLNYAIVAPSIPDVQSEPLFPITAPYGITVQSGDVQGLWVSSVLVQSILIGDGNWFNTSIMGVSLAWRNMAEGSAYLGYRHKHDFPATVPIMRIPSGDGQMPFIPLPGVAAVVSPDMSAQPVGAELSMTFHLGWLTI